MGENVIFLKKAAGRETVIFFFFELLIKSEKMKF